MLNPETATFSEFARIAGFSRSYITQLRKDDRLVFDGRRIRIDPSLQRIRDTADPAKAGVKQRWAEHREEPSQTPPAAADDDHDAIEATTQAGISFQAARAVKERYQAMAAKRDYELSMGKLLNAEDVRQVLFAAATTLRSRFENLPDTLGPQLAAIDDEARARATLADYIEHALEETASAFRAAEEVNRD